MRLYHPFYGYIKVPDNKKTVTEYVQYAKEAIEERYDKRMMAYKDMLEERLDLFRERSK